jgi:hypothetical protein
MRSKLATTPSIAVEKAAQRKEIRRKGLVSWGWRAAIAVAFIAANVFFFREKDTLITRMGLESVPSLPAPDERLSVDDQALYWTYALYDFRKFEERFGTKGYYAINPNAARKHLEGLLPSVSPATLGLISKYGPIVAYKTVAAKPDNQ